MQTWISIIVLAVGLLAAVAGVLERHVRRRRMDAGLVETLYDLQTGLLRADSLEPMLDAELKRAERSGWHVSVVNVTVAEPDASIAALLDFPETGFRTGAQELCIIAPRANTATLNDLESRLYEHAGDALTWGVSTWPEDATEATDLIAVARSRAN